MDYKNQTLGLIDILKKAGENGMTRSQLMDVYINGHRVANFTARIANARKIGLEQGFTIEMVEEKSIMIEGKAMRCTRYFYKPTTIGT